MSLSLTLLDRDMHVLADLTPRVISGSLVFNNTSGRTRTATLALSIENDTGEEHLGTVPAVYHNIIMVNQPEDDRPLALLLPTSCTYDQTASGSTVSLRLSDKYALLDGTLGGVLDTDVLVPAGSDIPAVISSLLAPFDPLPPVFMIGGGVSTYDIRIPAGKTISAVLESLADNMSSTCSYDPSGRLVFKENDRYINSNKTVDVPPSLIISSSNSINLSSIVNDVLVTGATVNGRTFLGRATNEDPSSQTCVSRVGLRTELLSMPDYCSDELCASYARRILRDHMALSASTTYRFSPQAFPLLDLDSLSGYTLSFDPTTPLEVYYS